MTKTALACALSVGLHGFLLTQWPLPGGRFPQRPLREPVQAVYLTAAAAPTRRPAAPPLASTVHPGRASGPLHAVRPTDQFSAWMAVTAPAVTPTAPAAPRLPPAHPAPLSAAPTRRLVSAPPPPDEEADPIPSLLTPADFARFRYKQMVRARLQRAILYPVGRALEGGRARLRLTITREGQVASASCTSVESPLFEESVMAGVTAAAPFPAFPSELPASQETYEFLVAYRPGAAASVSP